MLTRRTLNASAAIVAVSVVARRVGGRSISSTSAPATAMTITIAGTMSALMKGSPQRDDRLCCSDRNASQGRLEGRGIDGYPVAAQGSEVSVLVTLGNKLTAEKIVWKEGVDW